MIERTSKVNAMFPQGKTDDCRFRALSCSPRLKAKKKREREMKQQVEKEKGECQPLHEAEIRAEKKAFT